MMPPDPQPFLALRLDVARRPWRLPLMADLHLTLLNLPVAYAPGQTGLPFSFAALPGRYLAELYAHGRALSGGRALVLLNPAYDLPPDALFAVAAGLADDAPEDGVRLFIDMDGRLLAYVFQGSRPCPADLAFELRFLSGIDAQMDADLLRAIGVPVRVLRVRMPAGFTPALSLPRLQGLEALAVHVARRRLAMRRAGANRLLAVVTHHAGDVFLAMRVLAECRTRVDGVVVHRAYADIAREACPALPCLAVDGPLPARGAAASMAHPLNDELLYLENIVLPALPDAAAIVLMRPVRDYVTADTTLSAQLAFAVAEIDDAARFPRGRVLMLDDALNNGATPDGGDASGDRRPLASGDTSGEAACATAGLRVPGKRVLLHFDGGWPLKVYPAALQAQLVRLLQASGFSVSVLGDVPGVDAPMHRFTGLSQFAALLRQHDVLVGMDSFPCHYASQQLAMPVLCLFASTRIVNLAHDAPEYLAVSRGLDCSPCGSRTGCARFGGTQCQNFISPEAVVEILEAGLVQS